MGNTNSPKVFISYSWDSDEHKAWVHHLAEQLRLNGVDARLDQWYVKAGESFTKFMEEEVATANYLIIVCTPEYANKSNTRMGGVGYEQQIVSGQLASGIPRSKFVPIIRCGKFEVGPNCAIPTHFMGISAIDFRRDHEFQERIEDILRIVFSRPQFGPPPLGNAPKLETTRTTTTVSDNVQINKKTSDLESSKQIESETQFSILGQISKEEIHIILNQYKSMITHNPDDGEAHYNLALCYLQLKLYDLAIKNFKQALDLMPEYPDAYYYYALSLIRGRRPKTMSLKEIRQIEQYIETAIQLDDHPAKYYYLAAVIKFDYYVANGLSVTPPTHNDLVEIAQNKEPDTWEVERLLQSIVLRDERLISLIREN